MPDLTYQESQLLLHKGDGQVTLAKLVKSLVSEVKDFEKGADQADDITVLSVQMR